MAIKVISLFERENDRNGVYVNTTSKSESSWQRDLSPFYLGPCDLYGDFKSVRMENGWQYLKVYKEFVDEAGEPKKEYFDWAKEGWENERAVRYPMGRGKKPLYSLWEGKKLEYVEARKHIYVPLYIKAVMKTEGFKKLVEIYDECLSYNKTLYLKDYDAYRHEEKNMSLTDVLNNPHKKMGHAFVLMIWLTQDKAIQECQLP